MESCNRDGCSCAEATAFRKTEPWAIRQPIQVVYVDFTDGVEQDLPKALLTWASHPVGQQAVLHQESAYRGTLGVKLFDLQGKEVRNFALQDAQNGHCHVLDLNNPPGVYLDQTELRKQTRSGRLLVRKVNFNPKRKPFVTQVAKGFRAFKPIGYDSVAENFGKMELSME